MIGGRWREGAEQCDGRRLKDSDDNSDAFPRDGQRGARNRTMILVAVAGERRYGRGVDV